MAHVCQENALGPAAGFRLFTRGLSLVSRLYQLRGALLHQFLEAALAGMQRAHAYPVRERQQAEEREDAERFGLPRPPPGRRDRDRQGGPLAAPVTAVDGGFGEERVLAGREFRVAGEPASAVDLGPALLERFEPETISNGRRVGMVDDGELEGESVLPRLQPKASTPITGALSPLI